MAATSSVVMCGWNNSSDAASSFSFSSFSSVERAGCTPLQAPDTSSRSLRSVEPTPAPPPCHLAACAALQPP